MIDIVSPMIFYLLNNVTLNFTRTINIGVFDLNLALNELTIRNVNMSSKSSIEIHKDCMNITIVGLNMEVNTSLSFSSVPNVINGNGTGHHAVKELNGNLNFKLKENPGRLPRIESLNIDFKNASKSITGTFKGNNDLFFIANAISNLITTLIAGTLDTSFFNNTELIAMLNYIADVVPTNIRMEELGIEANFNVMGNPSMIDGVLPIKLNGTVDCYNKNVCMPYNGPNPAEPKDIDIFKSKNNLSIYITEHLLDTAFIALFRRSLLSIMVGPSLFNNTFTLTVGTLKIFIPNIEDYYNMADEVILNITAAQAPFIQFIPNEFNTAISVYVTAFVNKPSTQDDLKNKALEQAVKMNIIFNTNTSISLANNSLNGMIKNFKFYSEYINGTIQKGDMKNFDEFLSVTLKLLIPQLNHLLFDGIKIPPIGMLDLKNSMLKINEGYLELDVNLAKHEVPSIISDSIFDWIKEKIGEGYNLLQEEKFAALSKLKVKKSSLISDL